jgi:hypothetical protein
VSGQQGQRGRIGHPLAVWGRRKHGAGMRADLRLSGECRTPQHVGQLSRHGVIVRGNLPTTYHMQAETRSVPLNVMIKPSHMAALDRITSSTPGVENRSQCVRMLIEQADKALAAKA